MNRPEEMLTGRIRPLDQCESNALALMDNSRFRADCAAVFNGKVKLHVAASGWGIFPSTMARCLEVLYGVRS